MASTHPDPEDRPFPVPWEDDDTPGVSIHPLSHADIEAILAHMAEVPDPNRRFPPGPPPRSRARRDAHPAPSTARTAPTVSNDHSPAGRPGGSAQAEYQRRRAVEHTTWTRTLPWRAPATLAAGVGGWLAATLLSLPLPARALLTVAALAAAWWRLRFRPSPETRAWQRGAAG